MARTRLDVRVPAAAGPAVRVGDAVAEARPLAADVAVGSHGRHSPATGLIEWSGCSRAAAVAGARSALRTGPGGPAGYLTAARRTPTATTLPARPATPPATTPGQARTATGGACMLDGPTVRAAGARTCWRRSGAAGRRSTRSTSTPSRTADTGTNLYLTMSRRSRSCSARPDDADVGADAARAGARGPAGCPRQLRGDPQPAAAGSRAGRWTRRRVDAGRGGGRAGGLRLPAGYAAVGRPVEGTMLTVARPRLGRDRGQRHRPGQRRACPVAAAGAAQEALATHPRPAPALREAGVVDAGGRGLTVLLDALVAAVTGSARPARRPPARRRGRPGSRRPARRGTGRPAGPSSR